MSEAVLVSTYIHKNRSHAIPKAKGTCHGRTCDGIRPDGPQWLWPKLVRDAEGGFPGQPEQEESCKVRFRHLEATDGRKGGWCGNLELYRCRQYYTDQWHGIQDDVYGEPVKHTKQSERENCESNEG